MKFLRYTSYTVFILLFCSFVYTGITTSPFEVDSTSYHIPLAREIIQGNAMNPTSFAFPNPTYPGSTELLLAIYMMLHIPLNLFNVFAWVILFIALQKLAWRYGLDSTHSVLFSLSICLLPTVTRLVHTQTADLWLDVFFVWTLYLLQKPQNNWRYFGLLGVSLGMVAGAKFSGPLFCTVLIMTYFTSLIKQMSFRNFIVALTPFMVIGASWYIRNIIWYGNPVYPSPLLFFKGVDGFSAYMQTHAVTIVSSYSGFKQTVDAWISEYLGWSIGAIGGPLLLAIRLVHKHINRVTGLLAIGSASLAIYLILPGYPFAYQNIVSEVRYGHPAMIVFILAAFILSMDRRIHSGLAAVMTICPILFLLPFPHKPKIVAIIMWLLGTISVIASRHIRVLK